MFKGTDRSTAVRLFSVAVAVLACALTASCGPSAKTGSNSNTTTPTPTVTTSPPTMTARFTGLHDGSPVTFTQQVAGIVSGIPSGMDTWLVVQPSLAPQYWPQSGPLQTAVGGQFNAVAHIGESATQDRGEEFNLMIVSAPQDASQRFQEFLGKPQAMGMQGLPGGAQPLAQIHVKRS